MTLNLPNWQLLGMLVQVIWLPSHVWDRIWPLAMDVTTEAAAAAAHKKTDGDATAALLDAPPAAPTTMTRIRSNPVFTFVHVFWFAYMIYNWLGNRGVVAKHDRGDIGEGLRLSQFWVMYGTLGQSAHTAKLTGILAVSGAEEEDNNNIERRIDVFDYLPTRRRVERQQAPTALIH
ncbi:MAG: hypothetical protein ACRDL7_05580, partial [Gaiellaceae bacterium]